MYGCRYFYRVPKLFGMAFGINLKKDERILK